MRKRVGIFGGSFNPPHLGHAMVTVWALAQAEIDEVWWVPTHQHAFGKALASFALRQHWCELAVRSFRNVRVSSIERTLGGESRSIDTLQALETEYPDVQFGLVVGADVARELPRWKRWDLLQAYPIHIVGRGPGTAVNLSIPDVSSTGLRAAFAVGDEALPAAWMDAAVHEAVVQSAAFSAR